MTINEFQPVQTTPYSFKYKLKIYAWKAVNKTIFRLFPNQLRKPRIILLNLFGAKIAPTAFIHRHCNIEQPWNLEMGHLSSVGEYSWIYCLDKITIGKKCTIGKNSCLITGSHDISDINFKLITKPILIEDGVWVTTGVYIMPGVKLKKFTVVGAKSLVIKNTDEFDIVAGVPAKLIGKRNFTK